MTDIEEKILEILENNKEGILQNQLWKDVDIDSRKCSRVLSKLIEEHLVSRESEINNGTRTYRIKYIGSDKDRFQPLMAGGKFSPCTACTLECEPKGCGLMTEWIKNIY